MMGTGTTHADIVTFAIAFAVLGVLLIGFAAWGRTRVDSLLVDTHLGDRLDDDEHEYQATMLQRGVVAMFFLGGIFLAIAVVFFFVT